MIRHFSHTYWVPSPEDRDSSEDGTDLGGRSSPSGGGEWPTVGGTDRAHGVGGKMEGLVLRGPRWEGCEGCEPEVRKAVGPGREGACGLGRGTCTPS